MKDAILSYIRGNRHGITTAELYIAARTGRICTPCPSEIQINQVLNELSRHGKIHLNHDGEWNVVTEPVKQQKALF